MFPSFTGAQNKSVYFMILAEQKALKLLDNCYSVSFLSLELNLKATLATWQRYFPEKKAISELRQASVSRRG